MGRSRPVAKTPKLSDAEVQTALRGLSDWTLREGKLHRELRFPDFAAAFGFMTRVALAAEKADHHPDWSNAWNRVVIDLVSHDSGGITAKDVALARVISDLAG
jgi:4a-hydroxytetrahydrobiopterin dehydratase